MTRTRNINIFHKSNSTFFKNFLNHQRTKVEQTKIDDLSNLVSDFYQKAFNDTQSSIDIRYFSFDFIDYGYLEEYGYYIIRDGNRNNYVVTSYNEDINSAFVDVANSIIDSKAYRQLYDHNREIKRDIKNRLSGIKDYQTMFLTEYALSAWNKYFEGQIPKEIVEYYEFILNAGNENMNFKYDQIKKEIIGMSVRKRKLIK